MCQCYQAGFCVGCGDYTKEMIVRRLLCCLPPSWLGTSPSQEAPLSAELRIGVRGRLSIAGVSVLSVKDFQVAGAGDCRMGRLLPTQAGDEPLASRSLRPRYIFPRTTRCQLAVRQELRTSRDRPSTIFVTKLRRLWRNGLRCTT